MRGKVTTEVEKTNFQLRRSSKFKKTLNDILTKSNFTLMGRQVFVNVLKVDISGDFMNVKAFIDIFGAGDKYVDDLLRKLNGDLSGQIRNAVAKMIRMKFVPKITFCRDEFEHGQKILGLLEKIRMESEG